MRTTKPISTISFNSPEFLKTKLEELQDAKLISFWVFIKHLPEDDEGGKKEHLHLYLEPSKITQTDDLKEQFKEFDPTHPDKPLGCIGFRSSKFDDWYLYALHDKAYLASKGQSRKYHYKHEEMASSDEDELLFKARSINHLAVSPYAAMIEAQAQGLTWEEYFRRGTVPLPQLTLWEKAWTLLQNDKTDRNGRENHPAEMPSEATQSPSEPASDIDQSLAKLEAIADQRDASFYDVHPDAPYTPLDPDEELPW